MGSRFFHTQISKEDFIMKEFWSTIQFIFAAVGGWLGYFLGGCDGLLYALVAFVVVDYITGVMCAVSEKNLSSMVGFKGICRKVLIFLLRWYCQHPRCTGHWDRQCPADSGHLFLHLQ